jgi:SAM-dependent methyltransferase
MTRHDSSVAVDQPSRSVDHCRICNSENLHRYLDLGATPLANSYLQKAQLKQPEFSEDLCLQLCEDCGLSQLTKVVHPDRMFRHYLYVSSTTQTMREHFKELAVSSRAHVKARPGSLAIDVASNDGLLLSSFIEAGMQAVGVDPAENLAAEANAKGLTTECAYWNENVAQNVREKHGPAQVITACNVFAHADDLQEFMRGVDAALDKKGVFVIECPYALDFIEHNEFDTAYHEHLSYIALTPLRALMELHGFHLSDFEHFPNIHGGTIRVYAKRGKGKPSADLQAALQRESEFGIKEPRVYDAFADRVVRNRKKLRDLVEDLRAQGKTIWAYGASAKGNTLMNFFGLHSEQVAKAVDDNPKKHGYFAPGSRMEIVGPEALADGKPDYLLLLAWNFEKEIRRRCHERGYKGHFIVPVPEAHTISGGEDA